MTFRRLQKLRFYFGLNQLLLRLFDALFRRKGKGFRHVSCADAALLRSLPVHPAIFTQPFKNCRALLNTVALLNLTIRHLAFFNLPDDGQLKGQRVVPLSTFYILFHRILLKTCGESVNTIQDGTQK